MRVFLDFEASSLGRHSYPIEVAWVWEDGREESHLIRPAPGWDDWDTAAQAIHRITRDQLLREGEPHEDVARRMVDALSGHDLLASAPSWDGKWLSALLRAAGLPRHSLRVRDTEDAQHETVRTILAEMLPPQDLGRAVGDFLVLADVRSRAAAPAHRALPDARAEWQRWRTLKAEAERRLAEA